MNDAEKLDLIEDALRIMRGMQNIINSGPKDMLQAMFEFTKLTAQASKWEEKARALETRDKALKQQGKETGWEVANMQIMLASAYDMLSQATGATPATDALQWRMSGWLMNYRGYGWAPLEEAQE